MTGDPTGLDLARLRGFLDAARPGLVDGELSGRLIQGGRSNLTYAVTDGRASWVVRRPPMGHVLSTAHDMSREFRVLTALGPTAVPVPRTIALCADTEVLGAPFYVMELVDGVVYRTSAHVAKLGSQRVTELAFSLVDVLAELHTVDPAAVGLDDFGRPDGYLERQVRRWRGQLDASRSRPLAGIEELHARLVAKLPPQSPGAGIVHGDYRLDNVLVGPDDRIVAVLDWEMATLGDPLTDLGLLLVYWQLTTDPAMSGLFGEAPPPGIFPTGEQLAQRYERRRAVDLKHLDWYAAFACFKLAVILEGIHYRFVAGQTVGDGFAQIGDMVPHLVSLGHETLLEA